MKKVPCLTSDLLWLIVLLTLLQDALDVNYLLAIKAKFITADHGLDDHSKIYGSLLSTEDSTEGITYLLFIAC